MIIAVPPKTLSAKDKERLTKKGYVVIEIDDPDKVRVINTELPIEAHDYYMAALHAMATHNDDFINRSFVKELYRRLKIVESDSIPELSNQQQ